jgi:acylaminoacyl-peptidase
MASKYWFSGPPWEHPDEYINRSPLNHIKDVKTPTMLMAGEDDYRVPISEAEQYYVALKMLKVEALLVRFPGEPHGLSLRPSHQMSKVMYIASWFEQHKKG